MYTEEAAHQYLRSEVFPRLASPPFGMIKTARLSVEKPVYLYQESNSQIRVVGKLFQYGPISPDKAWARAEREYDNLKSLRERFGMRSDGYYVIAPLGKSRELSALIVIDYAPGKTLDHYIARAVYEQQQQKLFDKLSGLGQFFIKLHRNSEIKKPVSVGLPQQYLDKVLHSLGKDLLEERETETIKKQAAAWWGRNEITADREVIVHGDATPTNFLFHHHQVIGIDLEKMKWADRCWDLGFIAAELKHNFMWRTGNGWGAEPFIGHFLWQYATCYRDCDLFYSITRRLPLYMALGLLRIARNNWLGREYRRNLVDEARLCLEYRP